MNLDRTGAIKRTTSAEWRERASNAFVFTWNGSFEKRPMDKALELNREQTKERARNAREAARVNTLRA